MAFIQSTLDSAVRAAVDTASNALRTSLYGGSRILSRLRGASINAADQHLTMGGVSVNGYQPIRLDSNGGLASADATILLHEPFEGATISSPNRLTVATTTFTQAQTSTAGLNLNSSANLASGSAALVTSNKQFLRIPGSRLATRSRLRYGAVANALFEYGFSLPGNQTTAPAVGAFWQVTTGSVVQPVWNFNGTDVTGTPVTMPSGWQNNYYIWGVVVDEDSIVFSLVNPTDGSVISEQTIRIPETAVKMWNATHLPVFFRLHNVTAPATAPVLLIASLDVYRLDRANPFPFAAAMAHAGFDGATVPTTFAQAANWANAVAPTSATLAPSSPSYTTLGGQFQFAAFAGAETDFPVFGFTVPAPYSFFCTGIEIDTMNTGVAVGGNPTLMSFCAVADAIGIGMNFATHRRVPLGMQSLPAAGAIGAQATKIAVQFPMDDGPLITSPGRSLIIGMKQFAGLATASQIIRGTVLVKGVFV